MFRNIAQQPFTPIDRAYWGNYVPVIRWQLDTGSDFIWDSTGNNNNGTRVNAPAYAANPVGGLCMDFVPGSSQAISLASAPISAYPFWMNCWFITDQVSSVTTLMSIAQGGGASYHRMFIWGGSGNALSAQSQIGASAIAQSAAVAAGILYMGSCVFASATARYAYLNGLVGGSDATNVTPTLLDRTHVGRNDNLGGAEYFDGRIISPVFGRGAPPASFFKRLYEDGPYAGLLSQDAFDNFVDVPAAGGVFTPYYYHEHIARMGG